MLPSATLAAEINRPVDELQETGSYTGVAAFMVFALLSQWRVFVWYGSQREDIFAKYAPWTSSSCRLSVSDAGNMQQYTRGFINYTNGLRSCMLPMAPERWMMT